MAVLRIGQETSLTYSTLCSESQVRRQPYRIQCVHLTGLQACPC